MACRIADFFGGVLYANVSEKRRVSELLPELLKTIPI